MGLGTKIKEALHPDRERRYADTDSLRKAPGAYPADEVPRTTHDQTNTNNIERAYSESSQDSTGRLNAKKSADYTYGVATSGDHDNLEFNDGRRSKGVANMSTTNGAAGGPSFGNRLSKANKTTPYWGDATGNTGRGDLDTKADAVSIDDDFEDRHAHDVNSRYHASSPRDNLAGSGLHARSAGDGNVHFTSSNTRNYDDINDTPDVSYAPARMGGTSNLAHRPYDTNNTNTRDYKTQELDAPTNSVGRGKMGMAAGVGAGAAAGYGASELARRHHEEDMREYDTSNRAVGSRGPGMLDPYATSNTTTAAGAGAVGGTSTTTPPRKYQASGMTPESSGAFAPRGMDNTSSAGSDYSPSRSNTGPMAGSASADDHFGPGHTAAKVMHRCHNCGADNDISRHFRKDAVYRMS
ncbi:hypothetical protein BX600DRAFT_88257 [Xylariales sp. PMI_506]|nr:hypothetical protein BX600DRAFT_88257 [Xylariales sp. PMI_506]